jgi:hypothetical protein
MIIRMGREKTVNTTAMVLGGLTLVLFLSVLCGGPMFLVDWLRKRRQEEIARQVALTDAIDGQLGAVVAPVVTKPFFGPWEIRIAVPLYQSAKVAGILSVVDDAFPCDGLAGSRPYRLFLTARPDPPREASASRKPRSARRWAGNPAGA